MIDSLNSINSTEDCERHSKDYQTFVSLFCAGTDEQKITMTASIIFGHSLMIVLLIYLFNKSRKKI